MRQPQCSWVGSRMSGAAVGALALTAIHETARGGRVPHPPRMDTLGRRALARAA